MNICKKLYISVFTVRRTYIFNIFAYVNRLKREVFNKPFYVILNLAWGGDWGGMKGVDESALPGQMEVDYVRVFQKK